MGKRTPQRRDAKLETGPTGDNSVVREEGGTSFCDGLLARLVGRHDALTGERLAQAPPQIRGLAEALAQDQMSDTWISVTKRTYADEQDGLDVLAGDLAANAANDGVDTRIERALDFGSGSPPLFELKSSQVEQRNAYPESVSLPRLTPESLSLSRSNPNLMR